MNLQLLSILSIVIFGDHSFSLTCIRTTDMTGSSKAAADGKVQRAPNKSAKAEKQGGKGRADAGRRDKGQSRPCAGSGTPNQEASAAVVSSKTDTDAKKKSTESSQASSSSPSHQVFNK